MVFSSNGSNTMLYATMWMIFTNIILNKRSQYIVYFSISIRLENKEMYLCIIYIRIFIPRGVMANKRYEGIDVLFLIWVLITRYVYI